jgi:hypothetical protein
MLSWRVNESSYWWKWKSCLCRVSTWFLLCIFHLNLHWHLLSARVTMSMPGRISYCLGHTGWLKSLCAPDDYNTESYLAQSDCLAANRQGQRDTRLTLMPSVIPNSNYVIMLGDWNCLKYFCMFFYCNHQVHRDFLSPSTWQSSLSTVIFERKCQCFIQKSKFH